LREIGTPLLRRLTRGIELTEAGESFYEDACQILALSDAALEKTKGIARGMNGSLALGITSSNAFHPQIFALLRQFQLRYPAVTLRQVEGNMAALMSALGEGELDIAFVRLPCESSKAFNLRIIDVEPMVIALHRDHPLAGEAMLTLDNCRRPRRFCFRARWLRGCMSRCLIAVCAPVSICAGESIFATLLLLKHGGCRIWFCAGAAVDDLYPPPDVIYHPLAGTPVTTDIAIAWRRFERSRTVKRFLEMF
jgi:DNA-binding transcriptional LysR family regulator